MIEALLGQLGTKIFGSLSIALLIVVVSLGTQSHFQSKTIDRQALEIRAVTAERDRFQADAQRMVDEGIERTARGDAAVKEQAARSTAQRDKTRIQAARPTVNCKTPKEVLDADL